MSQRGDAELRAAVQVSLVSSCNQKTGQMTSSWPNNGMLCVVGDGGVAKLSANTQNASNVANALLPLTGLAAFRLARSTADSADCVARTL